MPALPPFRFFGGKGGVGKTTCAAAAALASAESGHRILIVSTDPAHSLGDALSVPLSAEPQTLSTRSGTLLAAELDVERALDRWLGERRETLRKIAERGTYLDQEDVDRLLGLSLPGADELAGLMELTRLARESGARETVVDTAPTAHTLRLMEVPGLLQRFAGILDALGERHRILSESFGHGGRQPDLTDELIAEIEEEGREMGELLRDPARASFAWVLLPEALAIAETRDALNTLDEAGIPVSEVIVNRVAGHPGEMEAIAEIRDVFGDRNLRFLPEFEKEPRGLPSLRKVAKALSLGPPASSRPFRKSRLEAGGPRGKKILDELAPPGLRLLFFGGKGGVGKTTCAAAAALVIAEGTESQDVLLLSTDPAHSLADVLETPLGDDERPIPHAPRLHARELDADAAFEAWRGRHHDELGGALGAFAGESREAIEKLLDITPPGLDELVALSSILDATEEDRLVVVDTAPTGHALRLLEAPELALEWDRALLSILLKYREAVSLGSLAAELVELSKSLKRLLALLRDPARARFVAVSRDAELPRRETLRLLEELRSLSISVPAVIINAMGDGEPRKVPTGCAIIIAPAMYPPPRGAKALAGWARTWKQQS
ncbi:MAG: arsenite/tail-anchored protein-transporting ATPase [Acidobacteriota bacterium]|jgi:arsenite-transporting ATPase|nr:arsenite/tail-anchored protein-transporting ATPase [Acidobacteriota bacterium]